MESTDIYGMKEPPWAKKPPAPKKRRRHPHVETFDEAVHKDVSLTHRRRSRNSGFRRLRHLLKDPEFSKRFWTTLLGTAGAILLLLILWDRFFRYPPQKADSTPETYRVEAE